MLLGTELGGSIAGLHLTFQLSCKAFDLGHLGGQCRILSNGRLQALTCFWIELAQYECGQLSFVEAVKLAFADRLRYCGDPRFIENPLAELLSSEYAEMRRKTIDLGRANNEPLAGDLPEKGGDTSYFAAADGEGNAISLIHSLSAGFGCGVVAGKTGVVLNNRAGRGFTLEEGHPNGIAGGKKTMHTLNCYLLCKEGRFWGVGGTPGGDRQVQWNVQTISNLLDFGMDVQETVEAPRWVRGFGLFGQPLV